MRLTVRGFVVLATVAVAVLAGAASGARSLNAVATPLLVATLFAVGYSLRSDPPQVLAESVADGHPGQQRRLRCRIDGTGPATVTLTLPAGVTASKSRQRVVLPTNLDIELKLTDRGTHQLGPLTVTWRDPLGLIERKMTASLPEILVYPAPYSISTPRLTALFEEPQRPGEEFDGVREYEPGDPLRRIHWPSSAKREEYVVREFDTAMGSRNVSIAAAADPGGSDEMARATLTLAQSLLDAGVEVGLITSAGVIPPDTGPEHRRQIRRSLAHVGSGPLPSTESATTDCRLETRRAGNSQPATQSSAKETGESLDVEGRPDALPDGTVLEINGNRQQFETLIQG